MEIADADKRAEWCYQTCCEIWEIQGRIKSRPLFRAIYDSGLQPMFAARESTFQASFELHQRRTKGSIPQGSAAIVGHLKREMGRLRAKWNTKLEIAARNSEHQERLRLERETHQMAKSAAETRDPRVSGDIGKGQPSSPPLDGPLSPPFSWRELEFRFKELQAKSTPQRSFYAMLTRTEWQTGAISEEWMIGGDLALRAEFGSLASIGARKLGYASGDSTSRNWLGRVRQWMEQAGLDREKTLAWCPSGAVSEGGMTGTTQSLHSVSFAELSAQFCLSLAALGTSEWADSSNLQTSQIAARQPVQSRMTGIAAKSKKQRHRRSVIFGAIQSDLKGEKYCAALDARKIPLPDEWKEDGCPDTYTAAYKVPKWRKRIQDEKSRHQEKYDVLPSAEREAIIQGESGTRPTRR